MLFRPESETKVQMSAWSVREVSSPLDDETTQHLVGVVDGLGRVCSPIQEFDRETMTVTTRSGKLYELIGPPGVDIDAEYVFKNWCRMNGVTELINVTAAQYWNEAFSK